MTAPTGSDGTAMSVIPRGKTVSTTTVPGEHISSTETCKVVAG